MLNNIKILLLILVLLAAATYFVVQQDQSTEAGDNEWLLPELQQNINQISRIELKRQNDVVSLEQKESGWVVAEASGFYANKENIVGLLMNLRSVVLLEKKTSNSDNFERLDLLDSAVSIKLHQGDQLLKSVLIGKDSSTGQGTFVRYADVQQAWLASKINPINVRIDQWLQNRIIDIDAENVSAVRLKQVETGELIEIQRTLAAEAEAFRMANIPEGQELMENANVGGLANGLANYMIDQAEPRDVDNLTHTIELTYDITSGLRYLINVYALNDVYYATVDVQQGLAGTQLTPEAALEMQTVNQRFADWMFVIPSYKFNAVNKTPADYLQSATTEAVTTEDNAG
ncbi:DUF4340 domain-containing protein [Marinicella sp. W31]|uniref:DUF4340 domain-containing protein n=1 Tax=Marinicella sp. W31 TaxID=3023713 RepID=UPI0037571765